MKWLLTLQSWEGCMWEKHTGVLCLCPPPNQKGQKEQNHCAGVLEKGQELQRAAGAAGSMRTSSILSRSTGNRGAVRALETLCSSAHQGLLQGAALPGCHTQDGLDLSPASSSDVAAHTLLWDRTGAGRQRYLWSCLSSSRSGGAWWRRRFS